jgi:hypothetical protein
MTISRSIEELEDHEGPQYESSVVFRLSNRPEGTICLRAAYTSFEEFKPDPCALSQMAVFRKCLSLEDFHLIISAVNHELRRIRTLSFGVAIAALVLTFVSIGVCVVSVVGGVSMQVFTVLIQTAVQAVLRSRAQEGINTFLVAHVNERLKAKRRLFVVFRVASHGLSQWCEVDFTTTGNNPLTTGDADVAEQEASTRVVGIGALTAASSSSCGPENNLFGRNSPDVQVGVSLRIDGSLKV